MSRLVRYGPRAARATGTTVQSQSRRAFSTSDSKSAPEATPSEAPAAAAPAAADQDEFKIASHSLTARKSRTQITDEALSRTPVGARVERLRDFTGVASRHGATDPVLHETIRRAELSAAKKDEKKKSEWNSILASNEPPAVKYVYRHFDKRFYTTPLHSHPPRLPLFALSCTLSRLCICILSFCLAVSTSLQG